jgi:muconolactone delta-isomerase
MEFLVTMTTRVPGGTPAEDVEDVRAREAAHTRELAARGQVVRLWRPPLRPGEWRTIGLFSAADGPELDSVLASMPLRVWRTDEVTQLAPHPNDPRPGDPDAASPASADTQAEFLVTFTPAVPAPAGSAGLADATAAEAVRTRELAKAGHLVRLWWLTPARGLAPALGLWRAADETGMQAILDSLPLAKYLTTRATRVTPHPSDPAAPGSRQLRVTYDSPADLAAALREAAAAHGRHEKEIGHADPDWPDWYAGFMVHERAGADHG